MSGINQLPAKRVIISSLKHWREAGAALLRGNSLLRQAAHPDASMRAVGAAVLLFVFAYLPPVASSSPPSPSSPPGPASGTIGVVTITLGVAGGVAVLAAIIAIVLIVRRRKLQDARDMEVLESSLAFSESFSFPLHLVSAAEFARMGKLIIFEDVRMAGQHRVMDLVEDARHLFRTSSHSRLIFLSHQVRFMRRHRRAEPAREWASRGAWALPSWPRDWLTLLLASPLLRRPPHFRTLQRGRSG